MVTTGFSDIHIADYDCTDGVSKYTNCKKLARSKSMTLDVTSISDNDFCVDDVLAESEEAVFGSGTLRLVVDGLSGEDEAALFAPEESTVTVGSKEVPVLKFGEAAQAGYKGVGAVKTQRLNGVESYKPIVLLKTKFAIPTEAGETREKQINWQVQELTAKVMRDDTPAANWKIIPKENFATKAEAIAFIKAILGGAA